MPSFYFKNVSLKSKQQPVSVLYSTPLNEFQLGWRWFTRAVCANVFKGSHKNVDNVQKAGS